MVDTGANPLDERLRSLTQLRRHRDQYRQRRDDMLDELHSSSSWIAIEGKAKGVQESIDRVEAEIKEMARDTFTLTGDKNPHAGVKVKMFTTLSYDLEKAGEWIRKAMPALLKPDFKAFEKAIKATDLPDFVTMEKEPRPQIVSDLGKVFKALEEAETRPTEELEAAAHILDNGQGEIKGKEWTEGATDLTDEFVTQGIGIIDDPQDIGKHTNQAEFDAEVARLADPSTPINKAPEPIDDLEGDDLLTVISDAEGLNKDNGEVDLDDCPF